MCTVNGTFRAFECFTRVVVAIYRTDPDHFKFRDYCAQLPLFIFLPPGRPSHKSAPVAARERLLNRLAKPLSRDAKFGMQIKEKAATMATPAKTSDNNDRTQSEPASFTTGMLSSSVHTFFEVDDKTS